MPLVQKYLVPPKDSEKHEYDEVVDVDALDGEGDHGPIEIDGKAKINNSSKNFVHSEHE